jgi:hypothetical protein
MIVSVPNILLSITQRSNCKTDNTLHTTRHMCTLTACVKDIHLGVFDKYLIPFAKSLKADGRQVRVLAYSLLYFMLIVLDLEVVFLETSLNVPAEHQHRCRLMFQLVHCACVHTC